MKTNDEIYEKIERRLSRLVEKRETLLRLHQGKEQKFTYWAGYELGYIKGQISILEDNLDTIKSAFKEQ